MPGGEGRAGGRGVNEGVSEKGAIGNQGEGPNRLNRGEPPGSLYRLTAVKLSNGFSLAFTRETEREGVFDTLFQQKAISCKSDF